MNQETANYDEPWKEALSEYFEPFLCFFFPEVHQLIDWIKVPQSLDKELKRITASSKTKNRFADKLYKVWLLSGEEVWILIHIEIQSQYEESFPQRMYIYNYRAFDLYHRPVISLAILGDERVNWRPDSYDYTIAGCEVSLKFPTVKLMMTLPSELQLTVGWASPTNSSLNSEFTSSRSSLISLAGST
jgi:hypothetical protein